MVMTLCASTDVARLAAVRRTQRGRHPVVRRGCVYAWLCTSATVEGLARRACWSAGQIGESTHPGQRVSAKDPSPNKNAHPAAEAHVRHVVSDRASPRVGALVPGVVVVLDVASDFLAGEKNMDRQCDCCDRRNDRHAKPHRRHEIDRPANSQHQKKDCADADREAVTDYPPLKGSRFRIPTAKVPRSLREGHRWRCSWPRPP
jgi:hypothetical protein